MTLLDGEFTLALAGQRLRRARRGPAPPLGAPDAVPGTRRGSGGPVVEVLATQEIAAPPTALWHTLWAVNRWTTWHPDVSFVDAAPALAAGDTFEWIWRATRLRSQLVVAREPEVLCWRSLSSFGVSDLQWSLSETPAGTRVGVRLGVWSASALSNLPRLSASLRRGIDRWLAGLQSAAERRR